MTGWTRLRTRRRRHVAAPTAAQQLMLTDIRVTLAAAKADGVSTAELLRLLGEAGSSAKDKGREVCRAAEFGWLADCAVQGEPELVTAGFLAGKMVRRWRWWAPGTMPVKAEPAPTINALARLKDLKAAYDEAMADDGLHGCELIDTLTGAIGTAVEGIDADD
jgi:hypothetical protein